MAQLQDNDLLLVNRDNTSYKITGAEFKTSITAPPLIQSVTLVEDDPLGDRFTSQDFTTTAVMVDDGNPVSEKSIRGWVEGSLKSIATTDEITQINLSPRDLSGTSSGTNNVNQTEVNNVFDGDASTFFGFATDFPGANSTDYSKIWTFNDPIPLVPGDIVELAGYCGANFKPAIEFANGSRLNPTVGLATGNLNPTGDPILVVTNESSITGMIAGAGGTGTYRTHIFYIRINGLRLGLNYGDLTVASDTGLADLDVGEMISQDSGYSPETNTITSVVNNDSTNVTLVLSNDKDLDVLKVGDPVMGPPSGNPAWNETQAWSRTVTVTGKPLPTSGNKLENMFDGNLTTHPRALSDDATTTVTFPEKIMGALRVYASVGGSGTFKINGTEYNYLYPNYTTGNNASGAWVDFSDLEDGIKSVEFTHFSSVISYCYAIEIDGKILVDPPTIASIISINEAANQINVDNGNWNNGEIVRGPILVPATGVVSSVNLVNDTISLSVNDETFPKRWIANRGKYVLGQSKIVDNVKKYLNLDASLNVIGLTDDVSYTRIPGNTLTPKIKFPAVLDNGQTPDVTMTEGTTIKTEFKAENSAGLDELESNAVEPKLPTVELRYTLGNYGSSVSGLNNTFDSGNITILTEPGSRILVVDNRTKLNGLRVGGSGGDGANDNGVGLDGSPGERARGAIYHVIRQPLTIEVTAVDGNGAVTNFTQTSTPKGFPGRYSNATENATFIGGSGTGFIGKPAKSNDNFGQLTTSNIVSGGQNYVVGDELSFTAPVGTATGADDLDEDWDTLIHGIALSAGGNGGSGQSPAGGGTGASPAPNWDGDGTKGGNGTVYAPGEGGDGGISGESTLICTAYDGDKNIAGRAGGGGGGGAGWGGGQGGGGGRDESFGGLQYGGGGGGGSGASYLNPIVTNWSDNNDNINGVSIYFDGSLIQNIDDTAQSVSIFTPVTLRDDNPSDVTTFNAIKNALDSYESDRTTFRTNLRQRLVADNYTDDEITTMGL